ncbi:hypothetical protein GPX89_05755 [Nocardia sp. ET3-3]|uniref:Uncharacterized protein n=1 Tax=Nocardia terrae TaxID=2675851 RepID=A0A7K1UQZ3_9NOCA|nr:hypothetical protein [Nocardia terrae]MVU76751.1 hypothetical protein [Nocardia terrae]
MGRAIRDRHRAPYRRPATLSEAKGGLDRHLGCVEECEAKKYYEKAVREMVRGPGLGWNIWGPDQGVR